MNKEYLSFVNNTLRTNAIILYNSKNQAERLDYDRHICRYLKEIPGKNKKEKILNSVMAAISLWNSWEIHIRNSRYPFPWYGCVQFDEEWIREGTGAPPYVIFNSIVPEEIQEFIIFKKANWQDLPLDTELIRKQISLPNIILKRAFFKDDDSIVWRICYKEIARNILENSGRCL